MRLQTYPDCFKMRLNRSREYFNDSLVGKHVLKILKKVVTNTGRGNYNMFRRDVRLQQSNLDPFILSFC